MKRWPFLIDGNVGDPHSKQNQRNFFKSLIIAYSVLSLISSTYCSVQCALVRSVLSLVRQVLSFVCSMLSLVRLVLSFKNAQAPVYFFGLFYKLKQNSSENVIYCKAYLHTKDDIDVQIFFVLHASKTFYHQI